LPRSEDIHGSGAAVAGGEVTECVATLSVHVLGVRRELRAATATQPLLLKRVPVARMG